MMHLVFKLIKDFSYDNKLAASSSMINVKCGCNVKTVAGLFSSTMPSINVFYNLSFFLHHWQS